MLIVALFCTEEKKEKQKFKILRINNTVKLRQSGYFFVP